MNDQKLRDLLEQLRGELEHAESVDEKGRALLRQLDADIRELLERPRTAPIPAAPPILGQRLEETIEHFEISHPTLTIALSELLRALNNAGI